MPKSALLASLFTLSALAAAPEAHAAAPTAASAPACPALMQHTFPRLQDEKPQDLCQYSGKVVVVVNTASYCGFTGQYKGLEDLYSRYRDKGLVVVGFPSNDFGSQEPGSNKQIAEFCANTYGVKFPMMAKSVVSGKEANPLYQELIAKTGSKPRWNFHKYVIGRDGSSVSAYTSFTGPLDKDFVADIESKLAKQP